MGINPQDLKENVIMPLLRELSTYSEMIDTPAAINLLLGTAAVESAMGHYLVQINGPAEGIYQMEPATYNDIWANFINPRKELADMFYRRFGKDIRSESRFMIGDLYLATCMARVHYFRNAEALPEADNVKGLGQYWKTYYNTGLGKGTVRHFIKAYKKYGIADL